MAIRAGLPGNAPLVDPDTGYLTEVWYRFLTSIFVRTGGGQGNDSSSFLYPTSNGDATQVLTSQGSSASATWTSPITKTSGLINDSGYITQLALEPYALLASPTFTGTPTAPTAAVNTDTNQIATTKFVLNQASDANPIYGAVATPGTSESYSRSDHTHPPAVVGNAVSPGGWYGLATGTIVAFGSSVVTTDVNGNAVIGFGIVFPNAVHSVVVCNGNANIVGSGAVHAFFPVTLAGMVINCPSVPLTAIRVNWTATGK